MKKSGSAYEPHLTIQELSVPACEEWGPRMPGWSVVQIRSGAGYFLQSAASRELEAGTVLLMPGDGRGAIRASQLGGLMLNLFNIIPVRLTGLLSLNEQRFLDMKASAAERACEIFLPGHPVAVRMEELCRLRRGEGWSFRLKLLALFAEACGREVEPSVSVANMTDARKRLQILLKKIPSAELVEMDFNELARITHCTARHLSRIFHRQVGMSFRDKRAELRLARARELLATTNTKVVDVALESGYKSLSLFNLMFTRHVGTSPGKWRKQHSKIARIPKIRMEGNRAGAISTGLFHDEASGSRQNQKLAELH